MSLEWGVEAVKSGIFKLLRPLNANDPYEMMGACTGRLRPEAKAILLDDMKYAWIKAGLPLSGKVIDYPVSEVCARVENNSYFFQMMLMSRELQQKRNAMLCFSDAAQIDATADQLMWSHYAGGGTGIRIWFESDSFQTRPSPLLKVQYQEKRPAINLEELETYNDVNAWSKFLLKVLITKSSAWSYEHEYRMIIPAELLESLVIKKDDFEFVQLGQMSIIRVDFGPKGFQKDTRPIIEELKRNPATAHIDFRLATFKGEEYVYDYIEIENLEKLGNNRCRSMMG